MKRWIAVLAVWVLPLNALFAGQSIDWNERVKLLRDLANEDNATPLRNQLVQWESDFKSAPCEPKVSWLLYAYHYSVPAMNGRKLLSELKSLKDCAGKQDAFAVYATIGSDYYESAVYDSAYYYFTESFSIARRDRDTNLMVLTLSNLASLYSEMNWKVEALSTALQAKTLASKATGISELTNLFLVNNVASLELDLGYYERAAEALSSYDVKNRRLQDGHIHVLRAVNYTRLKIHEAKGDSRKIIRELEGIKENSSAFVMASSFAVADSLCPRDVIDYVHDVYRTKWNEIEADTGTLVSFGIPALGSISMVRRIDESMRTRVVLLRDRCNNLPLGSDRLGYKLALAQMFEIPDFWEDYWRELNRIDARDAAYSGLQNRILEDFNRQIQLESIELEKLEGNKEFTRWMAGLALLLFIASALNYYRLRIERKKVREGSEALIIENERLSKMLLSQSTLLENLKAAIKTSGKVVKSEVVESMVDQLEQSVPAAQFAIPHSVLKSFNLTETEARVLVQLAFGFRNAEIAQGLKISKSYIHNLRSKLRKKLPLEPGQDLEDFAISLRKSYEPTK